MIAGITPAEPPVGAVMTRWPPAFSSEAASAERFHPIPDRKTASNRTPKRWSASFPFIRRFRKSGAEMPVRI
jgi:hypothetical protein